MNFKFSFDIAVFVSPDRILLLIKAYVFSLTKTSQMEAFNREHIMCFSIFLVHALVPSLLRFFENYSAPRPLGILLLIEIA